METFVFVLFCVFILNFLGYTSNLAKDIYPRTVEKNVDVVGLIITVGFLLWSGILLFG